MCVCVCVCVCVCARTALLGSCLEKVILAAARMSWRGTKMGMYKLVGSYCRGPGERCWELGLDDR